MPEVRMNIRCICILGAAPHPRCTCIWEAHATGGRTFYQRSNGLFVVTALCLRSTSSSWTSRLFCGRRSPAALGALRATKSTSAGSRQQVGSPQSPAASSGRAAEEGVGGSWRRADSDVWGQPGDSGGSRLCRPVLSREGHSWGLIGPNGATIRYLHRGSHGMVVRLRLARFGVRNNPFFRIVAADRKSPASGRHIEQLGYYDPNPQLDGNVHVGLNIERVKYWLSVGAQPSDPVSRLLGQAGMVPPPPERPRTVKQVDEAKGKNIKKNKQQK